MQPYFLQTVILQFINKHQSAKTTLEVTKASFSVKQSRKKIFCKKDQL